MDTFAAELLESVPDLNDQKPICELPVATREENADNEVELDAAGGVRIEGGDGTELQRSSVSVRLDRLSHFRIHTDVVNFASSEPHGSGGKAEVVKATLDGEDGQQVAVKKLRYYDDINRQRFSNEFVHEVDVMAQLSHKNIVKLIGFVEDLEEGRAWIILSWESNGNVSEFLATGEWEIPERISLIKDTFAGLEYLHTRQPPICHGDLKSHNILVSASYRAVITDFGSARILKETEDRPRDRDKAPDVAAASVTAQATDEQIDRTQITIIASSNQLTLTGPAWSLRWAAPEVALGEPQNLASDVWAAGWICWEVMTNKVPFPDLNSEGAIVMKVVEGRVPAVREDTQLSQITRLCSLMTDCWAFEPQNRPSINQCYIEVARMPSIIPLAGKASGSNIQSAQVWCHMGRIHSSEGRFKEAMALFQEALSIATSAYDESTSARALFELGRAYHATSKYAEAEQHFTRAQEIWTRIEDENGQSSAFYWMGKVYFHQHRLSEAEESFTRAQTIFSHLGSIDGQADTLRALGNISSERSQYVEAEEFYIQAIDIYTRSGHDMGHADTLFRLGELFSTQSQYAKAEELFNQAFEKYTRLGETLGRANVKHALGHLYRAQDLNVSAAPLLAEARSLYALIGDSEMEEDCLYWLDVVSTRGDLSTASLSTPGNDDVPSRADRQPE